ncbi:hydroxyproline dehydrogenase [Orycteropus afer afer]|uniref:Proline dehydrogenase n=1 Tax=Orycteropus afer afer TaxID=1230840 RepID=A0A8B7AYS2_ORYAF|nr:hydroxyproline dehydrogenase [Orycteropus afer afer]
MLRTCRVLYSQAGPSAGGWQHLCFDGGAFHLKGTGELTRALLVLRLCAWPPLVTHGLTLQAWSRRLLGSRLSGMLLRASIYGQFVAGETTEEVKDCVQKLQQLGLRPLLAVPIEEEPDSAAKTGEAWYERNFSAMLRCVDLSRGLLETPGPAGQVLMQLKVTALTSTWLCKELTSWVRGQGTSLELSPEKLAEAMDSGQCVFVGFNYAKQQTQHAAYLFSYSRCLELMLTQVSRRGPMCHLMVASHNEESAHQATKRMCELGIPLDGPVCFGQLLGMCDHVSLALGQAGYAVYKSIPYGSLEEVIPYLIRRAQENQSVLQGARREQELLRKELRRRLLGRA